jgi:quercetin dioxygenase-like cupin family protein
MPSILLPLLLACVPKEASPPPSPPASVRTIADIPRVSPNGKARVWPLAEGAQGWVGRLELAPGAKVPLHRDPTEETIVVLSGHGRITIDGEETAIGPGSAVFMPANAEVSFDNGVDWLVAVQVFAGPEPAAKYDGWALATEHETGVGRTAAVGPFLVSCAASECRILHGTTVLLDDVWSFDGPEGVMHPLADIVGVPTGGWLVGAYRGDGCPVQYAAVCMIDETPVVTPYFGNCEEPWSLAFEGQRAVLEFAESGVPDAIGYRTRETVAVDPWTCGVEINGAPAE